MTAVSSIDKSRKFLSDLAGGKLNTSKGMISKLGREFALKQSLNAGLPTQRCCFPLSVVYRLYKCKGKRKELSGICLCDTGRKALYFAREKKGHEGIKGTVTEDYQESWSITMILPFIIMEQTIKNVLLMYCVI